MPEGKLTRQRVRDHFRRLWAVYLAGVVALCFLNHLVYTVTRPGYSEEETLKIMMVNTGISLSEEDLLAKTAHMGFRAVETVELSVVPGDATSRMLLISRMVSGDGDIYVTDAAGLSVLQEREACHTVRELRDGMFLAAVADGQGVQAALEILIDELGE